MDKVTDEVMKMVKRIKTVMVMKMLRKRIKLALVGWIHHLGLTALTQID